jgi:hypothetical protein
MEGMIHHHVNTEYLPPVTFHILTSSQHQQMMLQNQQQQRSSSNNPYGLLATSSIGDLDLDQQQSEQQQLAAAIGGGGQRHYVLAGVEELKALPPTTLCVIDGMSPGNVNIVVGINQDA